jgi:hypothetical protein
MKNILLTFTLAATLASCGTSNDDFVNKGQSSVNSSENVSSAPKMVGYSGTTESGESCRVFIASVWNCSFGDVGEYYLFASITGNQKYKIFKDSDGVLSSVSIQKNAYAYANNTEDKYQTLNSLYEAQITLKDTGEKWICKDLVIDETRYNPFEEKNRCLGL